MDTPKQPVKTQYDGKDESKAPPTPHESPMSLPHRVRPEGRGYTVLSFDGGGYRGYASLLVLKNILRRLQPEGPLFPYLYFDLICGTSTGGLIAILLAVLNLDIDTAIKVYVMLGKTLFNSHLRGPRYLLQDEKFNRTLLKKAVSKILDTYGYGRTLMEDRRFDRRCKCFVTVAYEDKANMRVLLVRSYPLPLGTDSIPPGYKWTIMDAALATVAAPGYFQRHRIAREGNCFTFEDASSYGANNPTAKARQELQSNYFPSVGGSYCFVSIGTGGREAEGDNQPRLQQGLVRQGFNNMFNLRLRVAELSKGLVDQANTIDSEEIDSEMRSYMVGTDNSYYRFNPPLHEDIPLSDYKAISRMERVVYLYQLKNKKLLKECSNRINTAPAMTLANPFEYTRKWWRVWWSWLIGRELYMSYA